MGRVCGVLENKALEPSLLVMHLYCEVFLLF